MKREVKTCQNCQQDFTIEPDDFGFYEKIKVPPPTFCPECRLIRRLSWRNERSLYSRECELCRKKIISIYNKESDMPIYCEKCWWSDKWDPKSYAVEYNLSRSFFEQFKELSLKVPHMALINDDIIASVNCEYTQDFAFGKNCYMVFVAWYIENVMYSYFILAGKDMMDCMNIRSESNWIYECILCSKSYQTKYSEICLACVDSQFLYDCRDCTNCFMCTGLRNKKFFFKNQKYSKEEYEKILKEYRLDTWSGAEKARKEFDLFLKKYPRRYVQIFQSLNCTGDIISMSKNSKNCFITKKTENCHYCDLVAGAKDTYDMSGGGELSECHESITCDHSSRNFFGIYSWKSQDVVYTEHCHNCKHCFGCVGLRNANYCIFNRQYTKEEYEKLVPKIIEQMNSRPYMDKTGNTYKYGEFYPIELSPFGYNETLAMEQFPLTEKEARQAGHNWQDNIQKTTGKETLKLQNIPESINDVTESILEEVLACMECKRNYKIVKNELSFYQKMQIPIPRKCFHCRHANRLKKRNPFKLWHRTCMKEGCSNEFETSYAPDRPEIVYCEKCYQKEVY